MMADASSARDTRKERIPKQDEVHQKRITSKKSADGERFDPKERVRRQATAAGDRRIARIVRRRCANPRRESFGRFWGVFSSFHGRAAALRGFAFSRLQQRAWSADRRFSVLPKSTRIATNFSKFLPSSRQAGCQPPATARYKKSGEGIAPAAFAYATFVFGFSCSLDFPKNTSYQHRKQ